MATLTATFERASSRVRLKLEGAATATKATFYGRLTGSSTWYIVRGAFELTVTAGETRSVFDYEFPSTFTDPTLLGEDVLLGEELLLGGTTVDYKAVLDVGGTITASSPGVDLQQQTWLKFPAYPGRNRRLTVVGRSSVQRNARGNLLPVIGTTPGVAVQEFMTGRTFTVTARTTTWLDYKALDAALAIGGIVHLHADEPALGVPNVYAVVQGITSDPVGRAHGRTRHTEIELAEVSRPHYFYAPAAATCQTVLDAYDTCADLLAAYETCSELLEIEGATEDVIVA